MRHGHCVFFQIDRNNVTVIPNNLIIVSKFNANSTKKVDDVIVTLQNFVNEKMNKICYQFRKRVTSETISLTQYMQFIETLLSCLSLHGISWFHRWHSFSNE